MAQCNLTPGNLTAMKVRPKISFLGTLRAILEYDMKPKQFAQGCELQCLSYSLRYAVLSKEGPISAKSTCSSSEWYKGYCMMLCVESVSVAINFFIVSRVGSESMLWS